MAILPMFPLGSVLLPGAVLPLHVFEPRYQALVKQCIDSETYEFGVTLIERGSEVGGGDQRSAVGTVARIVQLAELGEGRLMLVCVGTRRFTVRAWLPDDPFPLADVDDWPDDWPVDSFGALPGAAVELPVQVDEFIATLTQRVRRAAALAVELGDSGVDAGAPVSDDVLLASYQLVALAPIGTVDSYALLSAPGPLERLQRLDTMLDDVEAILRFRLDSGDSDGFDDLG
ncbi:MAG: LON peptidase substrate-binding domain-containing protein [Actinomycetota bacterium]